MKDIIESMQEAWEKSIPDAEDDGEKKINPSSPGKNSGQ